MAEFVDIVARSLTGVWAVVVEASPWLLVGLFFAGLAKWALPERRLVRVMGRRRWVQAVRATIVGAPLPLCSCGVLPAALGLRREGLSRAGTASFLVATPQNGADSVALSYALLGPVFTVVRVMASLMSALSAGFATLLFGGSKADAGECAAAQRDGCGEGGEGDACDSCCDVSSAEGDAERRETFVSGQRYAFGRFLLDIGGWLAIGLLIAGLMNAWVDPGAVSGWASGVLAMLAILVISVPMYICAQASTPVAASMLAAGVSPGVVLVFLLAGPATNFAGVALVRQEIGTRATAGYLGGLIVSALVMGVLTDLVLLDALAWEPSDAAMHGEHLVPGWLGVSAAVVLLGLYAGLHTKHLVTHVRTPRGSSCEVCGHRVGRQSGEAPA